MGTGLSRVIDPGWVTGTKRKGRGNPAPPVLAGGLGLAVPSEAATAVEPPEAAAMEAASEAAGVGETYTMVEATAHARAEAVVAAVEAISTIGQIAVIVVIGIGVLVGTAVGSVGYCTVWTGVFLRGSRLPGKCRH